MKYPLDRSLKIYFQCLIRQLVGYHLNPYSPAILCFFFVFALIKIVFPEGWIEHQNWNWTLPCCRPFGFVFAVQREYLKIRVKLQKCNRTANKLRSLDVVFGVLPRPSMVTTYTSRNDNLWWGSLACRCFMKANVFCGTLTWGTFFDNENWVED